VDSLVRSIKTVVDKPIAIQRLGYCPTELDGQQCRTLLSAREDAIEVYCPKCRTTRSCDRMRAITAAEARRTYITWEQVLEANKEFGALEGRDRRVNERTLQIWRATGALKPRGYLRPSGRRGNHRRSDEDEPLYSWPDVEELRANPVGTARRKVRARR
jgi:hypothetical protein